MTEHEKQDNWQSWKKASLPGPSDLVGKWEVTVLSGALPNMHRLGHIKVIKPKNRQVWGYNRTLGIKWGKFSIGFTKQCAMFSYGNMKFYDKVRKVNADLLIGRYILVTDSGRGDITGYFQMRRKD